VVLLRKKYISDVEDAVKTHYTNAIMNVQVVVFQRLNAESIPGLNASCGFPEAKRRKYSWIKWYT
jgi:hypothetical protein